LQDFFYEKTWPLHAIRTKQPYFTYHISIMRKIIATLLICTAILSSCKSKHENMASKYLNAANLQEQLFTIDIHKDTNLVTQQGLRIKIDANSIEASTPTVTIKIKEALTLDAMLKAGLTTQTANGLLSSDGMFNITTKEESKIKKPLGISLPTASLDPNMQLYKGDTANGQVVWEEPTKLETKQLAEPVGKNLFMTNCASCHAVDKKLTGPALAWTDQKFGKGGEYKRPAYWFATDHSANHYYEEGLPNFYYCQLIEKYGTPGPSLHGILSETDIEAIFRYVNGEAKKLNIPETSGEALKIILPCYEAREKYGLLTQKRDSLISTNGQMTEVSIRPPSIPLPDNIPFPENVDTSRPIKQVEKVVPDNYPAEYYQFKIEAYGWYNIDVLVAEKDNVKESSLMVRIQMPVAFKANVFMVIPNKKIFVEGGLLNDGSNYGFYAKDGKIPLPQGETIYLFAVGESADKIYFSQTSFVAGLSQSISLELKETNRNTMVNAIAQLKLTDIKVDVKEVKNYKGIKALDSELMNLEHVLEDCNCSAKRDTIVKKWSAK
jgi:mono/diheme cytochrome c family protein